MRTILVHKLYDFWDKKITIRDFENWFLSNINQLESDLPEEDYLNLVNFNYFEKYPDLNLINTFEYLLDWSDYERKKIIFILESLKNKDESFIRAIYEIYEMSFRYSFFNEMAYKCGIVSAYDFDKVEEYIVSLSENEKNHFVEIFYDEANSYSKKIIKWIDEGKITFDVKREANRLIYSYNDFN
ncbi:MAG: hypothetical protein JXL97_16490 [Bacteroidales bacterium]|nr:hypothetical protein [Bacteroidales bacterium]